MKVLWYINLYCLLNEVFKKFKNRDKHKLLIKGYIIISYYFLYFIFKIWIKYFFFNLHDSFFNFQKILIFKISQMLNIFNHTGKDNLLLYGNSFPPYYDVTNVQVPCYLYFGDLDIFTHEHDRAHLISKLPNIKHEQLVSLTYLFILILVN